MVKNVIRGSLVALVGALLIAFNEGVMPLLVRLLGVVFFLPALVPLVNMFVVRKGAMSFSLYLMAIINIGSIIFGAWLMLFPVAFIELFVTLLAVVLLCLSLLQVYGAISLYVSKKSRLGLLVMPLLLTLISIYVLFNPFSVVSTATVVIGACLVVSGISDIVISVFAKRSSTSLLQPK